MSAEQTTTASETLVGAEWDAVGDDELFAQPYVDLDEWRDTPVRHRHVHGGFAGTDTRFSFYFPAADGYEGRFFQHVTPVPQSENLAPELDGEYNKIAFAVDSGAYFVETNGGGPDAADPFSGMDPTIGAYRANAAAARFSRVVAVALYGDHRPFGYLYGGSGGAYRTIGAAENTTGVWDGFVPYVPGSPMSIPNVFSVRMHAQRILRDVFPAIVDAYDAGGDPSALRLDDEQAAALAEVTKMGFPPRSWFGWETMGMHAFSVLFPACSPPTPVIPPTSGRSTATSAPIRRPPCTATACSSRPRWPSWSRTPQRPRATSPRAASTSRSSTRPAPERRSPPSVWARLRRDGSSEPSWP